MANPFTMLADEKIDSLDTHLEQFKLKNQTNQNDLQVLLREYGELLEDYKTLKTAYHDAKDISTRASSTNGVPVEKARSPYVFVLIDGNGYIFNDELIKDKEEGGMRAARMLNDQVERYLFENVPEFVGSRIVVRIYGDLTNLSKSLAKHKLVGLEKRSLSAFTAGFTRSIDLFDFVDALDEEGTKYKIRENFKVAAEDSACGHILYAACHDSSYLPLVLPYSGMRNKITLVQGAGFNNDFHAFTLNVTQFPTIFRWSELPSTMVTAKSSNNGHSDRNASPFKLASAPRDPVNKHRNEDSWGAAFGITELESATSDSNSIANGAWKAKTESSKKSQVSCRYFQKGFCRYGNECRFSHSPQPYEKGLDRSNVSASLPKSIYPRFIALNKDEQRIDAYMKPPTQDEWATYNARFRRQKPCNSYHLQQGCTTLRCPFDHTPLEPEALHALKYVLKSSPCPRKSACRASDCMYGHICQKDDCTGQMKGCRMKADLHKVDPELASMVPAQDELAYNGVMENLIDTNGMW